MKDTWRRWAGSRENDAGFGSPVASRPGEPQSRCTCSVCAASFPYGFEAFKGWRGQRGEWAGGRGSSRVWAQLWCNCGRWLCRSQFQRRYPQTTSPRSLLAVSSSLSLSLQAGVIYLLHAPSFLHFFLLQKAPTTLLYPHAGSNIISSLAVSSSMHHCLCSQAPALTHREDIISR